jgi:hypothetical protein
MSWKCFSFRGKCSNKRSMSHGLQKLFRVQMVYLLPRIAGMQSSLGLPNIWWKLYSLYFWRIALQTKTKRLDFKLQILNYKFWTTNFELQILNYKFWTTNFELQILNYKFWTTYFELQILNYKFWTTYFELQMLNCRCWTTDFELQILNSKKSNSITTI